ncbi:hypothetical protein N9F70_00130 [bacterium]|nr:hypothetical protein [bacterium]
MKHFLSLPLITALGLTTSVGSAADLLFGTRTQVSSNNANFDLSVFDGAASYNDRGVGGTEPGTPTFTNTFGDGTVTDYNFFHSPGNTIASYAKGTANLIGDATSSGGNIGGAGENWSNVWTVTDPAGFTSAKDFTSGAVPNSFARSAELSGTIDISGLTDGTIYIPHGTFINSWTLTLTMSGPGQADIVATDSEGNGPGTNFGWISEFTFEDAANYNTITYHYSNTDRDGSRARFMGVILDAEANFPPEDSDGDFLLDLWEDEFFGNNDGTATPAELAIADGTGDADNDGATNRQEQNTGANPNVKDTDNDGVEDGPEINTYESDPTDTDSDDDTLTDGEEVNTYQSNPTVADTDGDTLDDGEEVKPGNDGFETSPILTDTDDDGVRDDIDTDPTDPANDNDDDGISNIGEKDTYGTDPLKNDSDGDTILDGEEVNSGADGFITDPLDTDTDSDGFSDALEIAQGSNPANTASIPSGLSTVGLLDRVLVSQNGANFDLSIFPESASFNDRGAEALEPGTPSFNEPLGDGSVLDYNFFHSPNETIESYAKGEAGLIGDGTSDAGNINGAGENWVNVWTVTDPEDFTSEKDFTSDAVPNTFARTALITGEIDISGISQGTLYIPHGTFINDWTLTLTMSGPGQEDIVATDTQGGNGPSTNFGWVTSFRFVNTGGYNTITYSYSNTDLDGSRARFMGVILAADAGPAGIVITDITYTSGSNPNNIIVDLTFSSKAGRTYSIFTSNDLSLPLEDWLELDDGFEAAEGGTSSTFSVNFNGNDLPLASKQFFVVREN